MSEKYWLDKMNENPRYREIWEKIKEQPFNETTEMILDLEAKLAEKEKFLERIMSGEYIPANIAEKSLKLSNQTAIAELNNILDTFAIFVNEEKESMVSPDGNGNLSLLEYIENRIDTLKGEK